MMRETGHDQLELKLARFDHLSNLATGKLTAFERRLSDVKTNMQHMHSKTQHLTQTRANISAVKTATDRLFKMARVAKDEKFNITIGLSVTDGSNKAMTIEEYLESVRKVLEASAFFRERQHLRPSHAALAELVKLEARAVTELDAKFQSLARDHSEPIDLAGVTEGITDVIPRGAISQMRDLARALKDLNDTQFLETFANVRADFLMHCYQSLHPTEWREYDTAQDSADLVFRPTTPATEFINASELFLGLLTSERLAVLGITQPIGEVHGMSTFLHSIQRSFEQCIHEFESIAQVHSGCALTVVTLCLLESRWFHTREADALFAMLPPAKQGEKGTMDTTAKKAIVDEHCKEKRDDLARMRQMLEDQVISSWKEVEAVIRAHPAKKIPSTGTIHQLTSNVLQYIRLLMSHSATIAKFDPKHRQPANMEAVAVSLIKTLQTNIEFKARNGFRLPADSILFQLNNTHYIASSIRTNNISGRSMVSVVGESVLKGLEERVETLTDDFVHANFEKCLGFLLERNMTVQPGSNLSKSERQKIKDRFSGFNTSFREMFLNQQAHVVPDSFLRDEIRDRCKRYFLSIYQDFLNRYANLPFSQNRGKYYIYEVETVEEMITKFFSGINAHSTNESSAVEMARRSDSSTKEDALAGLP